MLQKFKHNLIPIVALLIGIAIAGTGIYIGQKGCPDNLSSSSKDILSSQEAGQKAIDYINQKLLTGEVSGSLIETVEESGVYKVNIEVKDKQYSSYVTKDGKLLFIEGINLEQTKGGTSQKIPQKDRPEVKLFVMSHCPYGLQSEKMFLPVYNLLKDKADMGIYFVDYIMHGKKEIDDNLRQYCVQKEQPSKYYDYLSCFVKSGDYEKCLGEADIDVSQLGSCVSQTDTQYEITQKYEDKSTWLNGKYPVFEVHADLNQEYKVGGSPTLVINDAVVVTNEKYCPQGEVQCVVTSDFNRSPEGFKKILCSGFNSKPQECSQTLSSNTPSPGFGEGGSSDTGSCK